MSVERPLEAWEEVQRHGQDLADRLAQGLAGLIQSHMSPPAFPWPAPHKKPFDLDLPAIHVTAQSEIAAGGVSAILDIGSRLGQAGAELGACINGVVQQFFRQLPVPFRPDEGGAAAAVLPARRGGDDGEVMGLAVERFGDRGFSEAAAPAGSSDEWGDDEGFGCDLRTPGHLKRPQGIINITSTYDTRTHEMESSLVARGDLWRVEASRGGSTTGSETSPLFLIQLGPVLFIRDTTLLLPVHLSKQHLLWYGYDRKNGMHSLCPALWSKHRRWLLMSMICLNPPACSFMDLQFPSGQLTYVAGEGLTSSAFLPVFGGLFQAQGQYPGETRISFSYKNKHGTRITPMMQLPDKSFSLGVAQAIAWKRSGLMVRPSIQFSICPTFGGSNPGVHVELIHSIKEELNLICGCSCTVHPSAFASLSLGRSKWNGHLGSSGVVIRVETPLSNIGRPSLSVQINSGLEF
ncbi:uncharacterized protein LOC103695887 [Phoenix dactylifera]|uniref:Uncharacterized protein LOC103695887 n=1 Tax=Phoenix dactylifera TaxID=42345 RepID=A0A8B7BFG3_PHODC|nr:uncharacterized protein LOC103695887 [Phoenix dactylifera]